MTLPTLTANGCAPLPLACADVKALLTGEHVQLWPYHPDVLPVEMILSTYEVLTRDRLSAYVFWPQARQREDRARCCSLDFYLQTMHGAIPLVVADRQSNRAIGCCWYDNVELGLRGEFNCFYGRKTPELLCLDATARALEYGHQVMQLKRIWGLTPWPCAVAHGLKVGFVTQTILPQYARIWGSVKDVYLIRKE